MSWNKTLAAAAASLLLAGVAHAADVKVTGLHNCCGACSAGITKALTEAGATNISASGKEVTFTASEADKAVKALFAAGYGGKVEGAKTPDAEGAKGTKATSLKLEGLHNCCGGCTKVIQEAIKPFGTSTLKARETAVTITSDKEIDAEAVVKALREAGYNAKVVK